MKALCATLESILKWMVILANGVMLLLVFAQVITRYVFGFTPEFGEELARYLFVWVVFLTMPLVAKSGGHMCIETLTSRVHGATLKTLRLLADMVSLAFLAIMVWQGCLMVDRMGFQTSPALEVPMSYVYIVIPFGCGVMLLYVLGDFVRTLRTPASAIDRKEGA